MKVKLVEENNRYYIYCKDVTWATDEIHKLKIRIINLINIIKQKDKEILYWKNNKIFIRRKRIQYIFNNKEYFYDTKVATIARQSGPVKIRVGKHGTVYERASYVYNLILGLVIGGIGLYLIQFIK